MTLLLLQSGPGAGGGAGGGGTTPATWDAATATAVTLSGGNLVATNTGTTSADQGARVATVGGKSGGKYYFEINPTVANAGNNYGFGVGTTSSTYTGMGNTAGAPANGGVAGAMCFRNNGNIWANGVNTTKSVGTFSINTRIGIAVDLDNETIWFRKAPAGNWNGDAAANPATNTNGISITAGTMVPFVTYGGSLGAAGSSSTANFGATAFTGSVPSGFTAGWLV